MHIAITGASSGIGAALPRVNTLARWLPAPTRWLMDRLTPPVRA